MEVINLYRNQSSNVDIDWKNSSEFWNDFHAYFNIEMLTPIPPLSFVEDEYPFVNKFGERVPKENLVHLHNVKASQF